MKISKLFHWLYSVIMLLPIFAIGVTCGYAMFNKNAYKSFENEYIQNYSLVNNQNQLVENNKFQVVYNENQIGNYSPNFNVYDTNLNELLNVPENDKIKNIAIINENNYARINVTLESNTIIRKDNWNLSFKEFYFTLKTCTFNVTNTMNRCNLYLITYNTSKISSVFYYSIDKVQQSPLFNWAENSFLVAPFAYIVSLFSMPTNSPIVMFLSYWLAISIIWLVFDLIMYVPLLTHRWIDKGMLE